MDHGEGNRVRPIVHLAIQDELVVHNHTEGQGDPDDYIEVRHANLLHNTLANPSFAHCCFFRSLLSVDLLKKKEERTQINQ